MTVEDIVLKSDLPGLLMNVSRLISMGMMPKKIWIGKQFYMPIIYMEFSMNSPSFSIGETGRLVDIPFEVINTDMRYAFEFEDALKGGKI